MIEFRQAVYSVDKDSYLDREGFTKPKWNRLRDSNFIPTERDFGTLIFRIDGVVFREWSPEFEKAVAWELLKR